jgi:hypothetical protein
VPPVVNIQFDTSGSMRHQVQPDEYNAARGAGTPAVWFNQPSNSGSTDTADPNRPAAFWDTSDAPDWEDCGTGISTGSTTCPTTTKENFERTCQIFTDGSTRQSRSVCNAGDATCGTDDDYGAQINAGARIRCWDMPDAVAGSCPPGVPADLQATCTTEDRDRKVEGGTVVSQPYTTIVLPDYTYNSTTYYAPNYLWWMLNEIYLENTPVPFIAQDRMTAAKQAVTSLVHW